ESISALFGSQDLLIYDLATASPHSFYTGAQILRNVQGRLRTYTADGVAAGDGFRTERPLELVVGDKVAAPTALTLHGYDRLPDGLRVRWRAEFGPTAVELEDVFRLVGNGPSRRLMRELRLTGVPAQASVQLRSRVPDTLTAELSTSAGSVQSSIADNLLTA